MKFNEVNLTINFEQVSSNNRQKKTKKKGGVAWERRKRTQDNTKNKSMQRRSYGFSSSNSIGAMGSISAQVSAPDRLLWHVQRQTDRLVKFENDFNGFSFHFRRRQQRRQRRRRSEKSCWVASLWSCGLSACFVETYVHAYIHIHTYVYT